MIKQEINTEHGIDTVYICNCCGEEFHDPHTAQSHEDSCDEYEDNDCDNEDEYYGGCANYLDECTCNSDQDE